MTIRVICLAIRGISASAGVLAVVPIGCYLGGSYAKTRKDLAGWHFWHCLWHVTGSVMCMVVMAYIHDTFPPWWPNIAQLLLPNPAAVGVAD